MAVKAAQDANTIMSYFIEKGYTEPDKMNVFICPLRQKDIISSFQNYIKWQFETRSDEFYINKFLNDLILETKDKDQFATYYWTYFIEYFRSKETEIIPAISVYKGGTNYRHIKLDYRPGIR